MSDTADATGWLLDWARYYLDMGLSVIPLCWPNTSGACGCGQDHEARRVGKAPLIAWKRFQTQRPSREQVEAWWTQWPKANIGVITGVLSGIVVLDADGAEGLTYLRSLKAPDTTWECKTGRSEGGWHRYFSHPGVPIANRAPFRLGLDIRGDGGLVVMPPSRHRSGHDYEWLTSPESFDLTPLPPDLLAELSMTQTNGFAPNGKTIHEGGRNDFLFRRGRSLHSKGRNHEDIAAILLAESDSRCSPPLPDDEVRAIARNAVSQPNVQGFDPPGRHGTGPLGMPLGEFLAREFPEAEPYIERILSGDGGGWIGGEEKVGKTFYALHEALCLALALPVLGVFAVPKRRRVMFVEEEDSPRRTRRRLSALLRGHDIDPDDEAVRADLDRWFRIAVWENFTIDQKPSLARLDAAIGEFKPEVIYFDVLRKITTKNLNDAADASAVLNELDRLRRDDAALCRVIHHFRKQSGNGMGRSGRGSQEMAGSFVLGAWAENSLFFSPVGKKQGVVRVSIQSKDSPPQPDFMFTIESGGPSHDPTWIRLTAGETAEDERKKQQYESIVEAIATLSPVPALEGDPGVPLEAICKAVKLSDRPVRTLLQELEKEKRVRVVGTATKQKKLYGVISE